MIRFSCLHFGQYNGKFFNSVSLRTLFRVLLPQTGHLIHSIDSAVSTGIELNNALSLIIASFLIPYITQLVNCAGAIWLKIERFSFVAFVNEIFQWLTGVF